MDSLDIPGSEMQFTVKSQSLRDKMKRRREAIQNLEASVASNNQTCESRGMKKRKSEEVIVPLSEKEKNKVRICSMHLHYRNTDCCVINMAFNKDDNHP